MDQNMNVGPQALHRAPGARIILPGFIILTTLLAACGGAVQASPSAVAGAAPPSAAPVSAPASIAPAPSAAPKPATSNPPASPSASPAASAPTTVQLVSDPQGGQMLADPRGMTLYTYGQDQKSLSNCFDACALTWPPLVAFGVTAGPQGATGVLDVMTRTDGKKQMTWNGAPLYTYSGDTKPGESNGKGLAGGAWQLVTAPTSGAVSPSVAASAGASAPTTVQVAVDAKLGRILADPRGMTVYTTGQDQQAVSSCVDACSLTWPPLVAFGPSYGPPGVHGVLDVMTRIDGKKQVTWNGLPLYTYSKDAKPGDTLGEGVASNWHVVPAA